MGEFDWLFKYQVSIIRNDSGSSQYFWDLELSDEEFFFFCLD